ncbi:hypothetical protein GCM10010123_08210 [Pilimelia anulata]|uniref:Pyrrolo-quinoline quinone repeat domain-containing protein n=1 Tax=Pilimelia anulata TaxID=53371 RepID=A0A8J3B115_9ACTN|nr:PQQ-binding-like beta-propeller repeat protein [Pilimelia anulata]GGJ80645.1 hypothetical protein GCM10010123_08210 [Pilimelia anulata]
MRPWRLLAAAAAILVGSTSVAAGPAAPAPAARATGSASPASDPPTRGTAAGATAARAAAGRGAAGWGTGGYGPGNTGYQPDERRITARTVGGLRLAWQRGPSLDDADCRRVGEPVVADGHAYVGDGGGVRAIRVAGAGTGRWAFGYDQPYDEYAQFLAVAGDLLLVGLNDCAQFEPYGQVLGLDRASGEQRWAGFTGPPSTAMVADRGVVVLAGGGRVRAFDVRDGRQRWATAGADLYRGVSAGGRLLLTTATGSTAVGIADGGVRWRSRTRWRALAATPDGRHLLAAAPDDAVALLDARTGAVRWRRVAGAGDAAVDDRRAYLARGRTLTALWLHSGRPDWRRELPGAVGRPTRAADLVYATVAGRPLAVLRAANGGATVSPVAAATGYAVVADGRLYTTDGTTLRVHAR